ncbi:hypothetical protein AURDEDRAFT_124102 [Auricularia subglabra TFB-10046 SS5]|nr:hypothetical protein AURDEDRAFT_124102 [Auricularia subglabra TFB-10046 SS5]
MRDLPFELVTLFFDGSTVADLIHASQVNRLWRAAAHEHRIYWQRIRLTAISQSALQFFLARLAQGGTRQFQLILKLDHVDVTSNPTAAQCVVTALREHLCRVTTLGIAMHPSFSGDIFDCLRMPAPHLISLTLSLPPDCHARSVASRPALPTCMLGGGSTTLRSANFQYIPLCSSFPPALWGITNLRLSVCHRDGLPTSWLYDLKHVVTLVVHALDAKALDRSLDAEQLRHVSRLAIILDRGDDTPVRRCTQKPWLAVSLQALPTAIWMLDELPAPLHLRVRCDPLFSLEYHAPEAARTRMFSSFRVPGIRSELWIYDPHGVYFRQGVLERITQLRLSTHILAVAIMLPVLPAVRRLVLDVADDHPVHVCAGTRLRLPNLETIVLSMHWPLKQPQRQELARFLEEGVVITKPVQYEIETPVAGDVSPLSAIFLQARSLHVGGEYMEQPKHTRSPSLFLLRLSRSEDRPINVCISWNVLDLVLDAVVHHLSHIRGLSIFGLFPDADPVLHALSVSEAPLMESLLLDFSEGTGPSPIPTTLPRELFAAQAPSLREVTLRDIRLGSGNQFPPCLKGIRALTVEHRSLDSVCPLPNIFPHCPNLHELSIDGHSSFEDPVFHQASSWSVLPKLNIMASYAWWVLALPLANVENIYVSGGALSVTAMIDMLGPRVAVGFDWRQLSPGRPFDHGGTRLRNAADTSGRRRLIDVCIPKGREPEYPYDAITGFQHAPAVGCIVQLVIAVQNWNDLVGRRHLTRFPALEELVLTISYWPPEDGWSRPEPTARLSCPRLERLVLRRQRWSLPPVVDARNVVEFAVVSLADVRFPIVLELNAVAVEGSLEESRDLFSFVVATDEKEYEFNN